MQISGYMVLKRVNWVHNIKNIGVTFLGKWSFISLRNLWISVFDVVLLKAELKMWFLQFLNLNLPENCGFQTKICGFHQNPQFSSKNHGFLSKSMVFIKICRFSSKPAVFVKYRGFS